MPYTTEPDAMNDLLQDLIECLIRQTPVYLVLVAGLGFAVARWQRQRSASAWAIAGFAWLIVFGLFADVWRDLRLYEFVIPEESTNWLIDCLSCSALAAVQSVGLLLLLTAVYAGRPWRYHPHAFDPHDVDEPIR